MGPSSPTTDPRDVRQADLAFACSVLAVIFLWGIVWVWFPSIATLLFVSGILAYALLPVVDWLHHRHVPRTIGVLLVALVGAGLITLLVYLMAPAIAAQFSQLPDMVRETWDDLQALWGRIRDRVPARFADDVERFTSSLQQRASEAMPASRLADWGTSAAAGVGSVASGIVFIPVFVFLMLRGYHQLVGRSAGLVPPRWRARFEQRAAQADDVLAGFIRGQLLVALIIAVLYSLAFSIIGIPLALLVGLLAGFGELVPYLGGAIALVLASILALAGGQPLDVLWVVAAFALIQGIEGALISPWIMGKRVELGPAIVIVAIVIGGELFGFVGLLLAVPAAALLKVAGRAAIDAYRASPFFLRRRPA